MFERPHHQRIARVLEALDADLLLKNRCLFGGGTAIALVHGEYRESLHIDFVCSSVDGYRELRSLVHKGGIDALFESPMPQLREPRIDQYGIRCAVAVDDVPVKLEIVFEGIERLSQLFGQFPTDTHGNSSRASPSRPLRASQGEPPSATMLRLVTESTSEPSFRPVSCRCSVVRRRSARAP